MLNIFAKPKNYFPKKEIEIYVDKNNVIHAKYKNEDGTVKFADTTIQEDNENNFLNGVQEVIAQLINSPKITVDSTTRTRLLPKRIKF